MTPRLFSGSPVTFVQWLGFFLMWCGGMIAMFALPIVFLRVTVVHPQAQNRAFFLAMAGLALIFVGVFLMLRESLKAPAGDAWWRQPAALALVAANLVPAAGVVFLEWNMFSLLLLYWLESVVAGVCTTFKVYTYSRTSVHYESDFIASMSAFALAVVCALYGVLLLTVAPRVDGSLLFFDYLLGGHGVLWPFAAIAISHGISTVIDVRRLRQLPGTAAGKIVAPMIVRVFQLHFTVMGGLYLTYLLGSPAHVLLALVLLKTYMELVAHAKEFIIEPAQDAPTADDGSAAASGRPLAHFEGTWELAPGHPRTPGWFSRATFYQEAGRLRLRVADVAGPGDAPDALESLELHGSAERIKSIDVRLKSGSIRRNLQFIPSGADLDGLDLFETQHPDGDRKAMQARTVALQRRGTATGRG